jgi:hypothetical protein
MKLMKQPKYSLMNLMVVHEADELPEISIDKTFGSL